MSEKKFISVVLGSLNRIQFLKPAVESIRKELEGLSSEIIVVDGGSNDGTIEWLFKQKDIITIVQHNKGKWAGKKLPKKSWGYFMNLAFKAASGKYICMLSDDCLIVPGAIKNGFHLFEEKLAKGDKIGAAAFYWRNWPEEKEYYVCKTLGGNMLVNHGLYLRSAIEEVGYIDDENFKFYHADDDLALKLAHNGYKCIDSSESFIEHYLHANTGLRKNNSQSENDDLKALLNKWKDIFPYEENNIHSFIKKDFKDKNQTYKKFKQIELLNPSVGMEKIKRKIIKKLLKV